MEFIRTSRNGPVLTVILDRPPANAITPEVGAQMYRVLSQFRDDPNFRVAIVTSAGNRIFCAGWDLKEVAKAVDPTAVNSEVMDAPGGFAGITELWDLHKPIIAAVNGAAIGGGFEIVLAADVVVAAESAHFALPEMQRGFVPDAGAIQRLPRRIPYNVAMELMLTGRRMDVTEAARWGLVNFVVPSDQLMLRAQEIAIEIAKGAPLAVEALLEVVPAIDRLDEREAFHKTKYGQSGLPRYERMLRSEDFLEGPRAYAEKREPNWKGR